MASVRSKILEAINQSKFAQHACLATNGFRFWRKHELSLLTLVNFYDIELHQG